MNKTIDDVRNFWENNPLWVGESHYEPGSREFFEEHRQVVINDCLAGRFDGRILPFSNKHRKVLDLGCGPGFWTVELIQHGCKNVVAADLTSQALELTKKRLTIHGLKAQLSQQNAEAMTFPDGEFSHVNCQGVIHHTPNPEACLKEMARVLEKDGTACISVYYRNIFLRTWPIFKYLVRFVTSLTEGGLYGRGREKIFEQSDTAEIVRIYDGADNPIGKSYSKRQFKSIFSPYFNVENIFLHFFPARGLPLKIPQALHLFLDRYFGFVIYATLRKK